MARRIAPFVLGALALPRPGAPRHEAVFTVTGADVADLAALQAAIAVEAGDPLAGADVSIEPAEKGAFCIRVRADDLTHLRAATNSYLKWLAAAHGALAAAADTADGAGNGATTP